MSKIKASKHALLPGLLLGLLLLTGLAQAAEQQAALYQVSTIEALLEGAYEGQVSIGQLARHGDFGLGTLDGLDGELVVLEGKFYQVRTDGKAYPVPPQRLTPFANVAPFKAGMRLELGQTPSVAALEQALDKALPSANYFYAVRVDGQFEMLKARSVPAQVRPFPRLVEVVAKQQAVFDHVQVRGTLVGLRTPAFAKGINVPGYHFHFLDETRQVGGHVLELKMLRGQAQVCQIEELRLVLPKSGEFLGNKLGQEHAGELKIVEQGR